MISVCMATYNGARFIKEQIDSILPQLAPDDELIVSDDGSTDGTLEILAEYAAADQRVKVLHHKRIRKSFYKNLLLPYVAFNFENALKNASGDYIFLADQDDVWISSKVAECMKLMGSYDYVLTNLSFISESGDLLKERVYFHAPFSTNVLKNCAFPVFWGCCACFRRRILELSLPFPKTICLHDFWIGLVATKFGKTYWYDKPLILHRLGNQNTSSGGKKSKNSFFVKFLYRFYAFCEYLRLKDSQ